MNFYTKKRRSPVIAIVSLIDILAILLIFFIITTTFKKPEPQVKINLPESRTAVEAPAESEPAILYVAADGTITVDGSSMGVDGLGETVAAIVSATPERSFSMRADKEVDFGIIIEVMDIMKEQGVENLSAFTDEKAP